MNIFKKIAIAISTLLAITTFAVPAFAANTVVYNSLPSVSPTTNYPSQPFQAQQTSEFGDYIHLGGTARVLKTVTVTMSDWALFSTYASDSRYSSDAAHWTHPITLNVYSNHLDANGTPDQKLATVTQTISIPWRPVASGCDSTAWKDSTEKCNNGLAFNAVFDLSSLNVTLPKDIIVSVAFNTQTYGSAPIGVDGPYNSLNVAVPDTQAVSVGTDDNTDATYWNSTTGTNGVFRQNTGWTPNGTVALQVTASDVLVGPPMHNADCKDNGYKNFNNPSFKNQGQCVDYVEKHKHKVDGDDAQYNAYGLNREADFDMDTASNKGNFTYTDANKDKYKVKVSDVMVSGHTAWFAGQVVSSKNNAYNGNWLFAKVVDNGASGDQLWGSFVANQTTAYADVDTMATPTDGPFTLFRGNIKVQ
ncbi:hypothetical protein BH09PAT1_BH09PAT1_2850 [soil metagenome]